MLNLFAIKKTGYTRINSHHLPAKPDGNPQFVYTGRGFRGKPDKLEEYLRGGMRYSERRRQEIQSKMAYKDFFKGMFGCMTGNRKLIFIINNEE